MDLFVFSPYLGTWSYTTHQCWKMCVCVVKLFAAGCRLMTHDKFSNIYIFVHVCMYLFIIYIHSYIHIYMHACKHACIYI